MHAISIFIIRYILNLFETYFEYFAAYVCICICIYVCVNYAFEAILYFGINCENKTVFVFFLRKKSFYSHNGIVIALERADINLTRRFSKKKKDE